MTADLLARVEAHLVDSLGPDSGSASVTFLGLPQLQVRRHGPSEDGTWRYITLGMCLMPMSDPSSLEATTGPRAEVMLSVNRTVDGVARALATVAAAPAVEGMVLAPGSTLDLQEPLWEGSRFRAVLVAEPSGVVPDLDPGDGAEPVRVLPLLLMTASEAAYARAKGAAALRELWLAQRVDLRDPERREVDLSG